MDLLTFLQRNKRKPLEGETWYYDDGSPFKPKGKPVMVKEVKDGWIRYDTGIYKDERSEIKYFIESYKHESHWGNYG